MKEKLTLNDKKLGYIVNLFAEHYLMYPKLFRY